MTLELLTRPCAVCQTVCVEYDTGDAHRIPRSVRAVFPRIRNGARICEPCDDAQHRPGEIRTFQLEAGMSR